MKALKAFFNHCCSLKIETNCSLGDLWFKQWIKCFVTHLLWLFNLLKVLTVKIKKKLQYVKKKLLLLKKKLLVVLRAGATFFLTTATFFLATATFFLATATFFLTTATFFLQSYFFISERQILGKISQTFIVIKIEWQREFHNHLFVCSDRVTWESCQATENWQYNFWMWSLWGKT